MNWSESLWAPEHTGSNLLGPLMVGRAEIFKAKAQSLLDGSSVASS
ncbi:unnamed protein product [Penicillium roqueforti FM164]|uniref:Genomic scaffold, ProqFM164S03 n=1 Tax=Penicillium roqueforti (strain FM164) TaxID=1365484 RepID=W6QE53_PENRF|nr:unnamed protein product [Penicillium roqueforti FM164]